MTVNGMQRRFTAAIVGGALAVGLAACGSDDSGGGSSPSKAADGKVAVPEMTIGWVDATLAGAYQQRLYKAGEAAAKSLGWKLKTVDTGGEPAKTAQGVSNLVDSGVDAIVMSSITPATARAGLVKAKAKGIPVAMIGSQVDDKLDAELDLKYYGKLEADLSNPLADRIVETLKPGDEVGILMTSLLLSGKLRSDAVKQRLTEAGIKVVGELETGFAFNDALRNASSLIKSNPKLKAIIPVYDIWTPATVSAIKSSGKDVKVFAYEAGPPNADLTRKNPSMILALVDNNSVISPLIAFDQLLGKLAADKPMDPNAADGKFEYTIVDSESLPPKGQNGTTSLDDALAPYLERWSKEYALPAAS